MWQIAMRKCILIEGLMSFLLLKLISIYLLEKLFKLIEQKNDEYPETEDRSQ